MRPHCSLPSRFRGSVEELYNLTGFFSSTLKDPFSGDRSEALRGWNCAKSSVRWESLKNGVCCPLSSFSPTPKFTFALGVKGENTGL